MFNTCELFPFFCFKESESDKYIQYPSICFRFFKKELEKAARAANTVVVQHSEVTVYKGFVYR